MLKSPKSRWKQAQKGRREGETREQAAEGGHSYFPVAETFSNIFADVGQCKELVRNNLENQVEHVEQYSTLVHSAYFPLSLLSRANEALMKLVSCGLLTSGWNCWSLVKHELP